MPGLRGARSFRWELRTDPLGLARGGQRSLSRLELDSGALTQGFDLAALDELLERGRAAGLPLTAGVLKGDHRLAGAGVRIPTAGWMTRALSVGGRCSRLVEVCGVGVRRLHQLTILQSGRDSIVARVVHPIALPPRHRQQKHLFSSTAIGYQTG